MVVIVRVIILLVLEYVTIADMNVNMHGIMLLEYVNGVTWSVNMDHIQMVNVQFVE